MSYSKVTDPSLIDELNNIKMKKVTDPLLIKQLNESKNKPGASFKKFARESGKSILSDLIGKSFKKIPFIGEKIEEPAAKAGYGGIPAIEQLPQGLKEGGLSALSALIGKSYQNEPVPNEYGAGFGRSAGQMLGQGAVAAAPATLTAKALSGLGIPKAIASLLGTGAGFGATTQGDVFERGLAGAEASALHGAGKAISAMVKGNVPVKPAIKKIKSALDIGKNAKERNLARELTNQKELQKTNILEDLLLHKQGHAGLLEEQLPIKSQMIQNPLLASSEENILKRKANIATQQKEQLGQELMQHPEMSASKMPQKPIVQPENLMESIKKKESLLKENKQKAAEHEEMLQEHLGKGKEHGVPIAEHVVNTIEGKKVKGNKRREGGLKQEIGKEYDAIEEQLKDKNITIPRTESIEQIENEYRKLLESYKHNFDSDEDFEKAIKTYAKADTKKTGVDIIPANEFLNNFRSARKLGQKMQSSAYEKGITKDEQAIRNQKANEMIRLSDDMEHIIEQQKLGDSLKQLKKANKRWREEITPLYENSVYKNFLNKGYASNEDLIKSLRGNKEGQIIIRNIIKKSPEMTKRIIGMSHAEKPSELIKPRELTEEYLNLPHMQETRKLVGEFKSHLDNIKNDESQLIKLKEAHKANEGKSQKNLIEQQRRDKANSLYDNMVKLDSDVAELEHAAETAKRLASQKNISLKEKIRLEKEAATAKEAHKKAEKQYKEAELIYRKSIKDAFTVGGLIGGSILGSSAINKAKKMIMD